MIPIYLTLLNGLPLMILPENKPGQAPAFLFQIYAATPGYEERSLQDMARYLGLLSFNPQNGEFYYTAGNDVLEADDIRQIKDCIEKLISPEKP